MNKIKSIVPKVMIVDDDQLIQDLYKEYFDDLGHKTITCGDGDSALTLVETFSPDIMIIDLNMPGMNGLKLMEAISNKKSDIETIIISGSGEMKDSIRSFRNGATDFLTKPVDPKDMMTAYNNAVKRILIKRTDKASPLQVRSIVQVLIRTYDTEKKQHLETLNQKLTKIIFPQIDQLSLLSKDKDVRTGLKFIKELLLDTFSFSNNSLAAISVDLSPIEIKICDLISQWKDSQEISELLNLSIYTVYDHRKRIRKKIGLQKNKGSLDKYLRSRKNQVEKTN